MSKVFRRPMFRKGGNVGEGIMTGIVDREQYQVGTPDPFVSETRAQWRSTSPPTRTPDRPAAPR